MYRIAIVDDAYSDVGLLKTYIEKYAEENQIKVSITECMNGFEFLEFRSKMFDIVFLDIRMPLINGFEVAQKIRKSNESISIVFVTNMVNYAIRGYEVSASDYMLKPLEYSTFAYKFAKILRHVNVISSDAVVVKTNGGQTRIQVSELNYVESVGHKAIYHLEEDMNIESWDSLTSIYATLKEFGFEYCNRCYIVNCAKVTKIENNTVEIDHTIKLEISRQKKKSFLNALALNMA